MSRRLSRLWPVVVLVCSILALITRPAFGEPLRAGVLYEGGTTLEVPQLGVTLKVPAGWQALLPQGSDILMMEKEGVEGRILATARPISSVELRSWLTQPIELGDGVTLQPNPPLPPPKDPLKVEYTVVGSPMPMAAYGRGKTGKHGVSAAVVGLYRPTAKAEVREGVDAVMTSFSLKAAAKPKAPTAAAEGQLASALAGRKLVRLYTGSGYSEKEQVWLCSDGTFHRSAEGGGFGMDGASGAFRNVESGRWSATGTATSGQVTLRFENGGVSTHTIELQGGKLYVDGTRWFRTANDYCR